MKRDRIRGDVIHILTTLLLTALLAGPLVPSVAAQRGALTVSRNLNELVAQAATILRGHIKSRRVERHPELTNLFTVVITVKVEEVFKGEAGPTFTFRQYVWDFRDRQDRLGYKGGQHVLLLMNKPSRYGLSSPVALQQGRFRILRDARGGRYAVNGHANAGLFRDFSPQLKKKGMELESGLSQLVSEHRSGPIALGQLEQLIRTLVGEN